MKFAFGADAEQLDTMQMIQEMKKMSILNEKLLVAQMSLLTDFGCDTQTAVEYCRHKLKHGKTHEINAEKVNAGFPWAQQKSESM